MPHADPNSAVPDSPPANGTADADTERIRLAADGPASGGVVAMFRDDEAGEQTQDALSEVPADEQGAAGSSVPCEFICGVAGSGKTYSIRERIHADPSWGLLCATTGIAAINLGTVTLNSTLKFFDTDSLRDAYLNGSLVRRLRDIREDHRRLVIDEVSMMDGDQLGILVRALLEVNTFRSATDAPPLGLTLVGDFAQLPPVKARWAFESDEWHRFDGPATTRLTKVWRQGLGPFLDALNLARAGDGAASAEVLSTSGLEWHSSLAIEFDGTTIVPRNDQVDRYNGMALDRLPAPTFTLSNRRWGKQRGEWKQVPDRVTLKSGAYVMLLANSYDDEGRMQYANGDCGHVEEHGPRFLRVRLLRNDVVVDVEQVTRDCGRKDKPEGWDRTIGHGEWLARPHWMPDKRRFVEGQVEFWPVRLAYASTVHKSQGLSLDRAQIDIRDHFFAQPAMAYVALSRCRTLEGLRIVGQRERYVKQCNIDERVRPWL
jgi:ATP-dependent DNA helicase PIF1